ncbi:MAG: TolC family protein [Bacteroidales bacterium]
MRKLILSGLLITTSLLSATEKREWNLEECINYALEQNIDIKNLRLRYENAKLDLHTSKMSRLPDLSASFGENFDFGRSTGREGLILDRNSANSSLSISSNVALFNGLRTHNQIKANQFAINALTEDLQKANDDLTLSVTGLFMQILYNRDMLRVAQDQVKLSLEQVTRTEALYHSGKVAESELYEALASLAKNRQSVVEAQNSLLLSNLDLAQALEIENTQEFEIIAPIIESALIDAQSHLEGQGALLLSNRVDRPATRAAAWRIKEGEKQIRVAKSAYYPSLSFGAFYSNGYYHIYGSEFAEQNQSFGDQLKNNSRYGLGLSLNIPIFNRFATRNQVKSAKLNVESLKLNLIQAQKEIYKELEQAFYNARAANERFKAAHEAMIASEVAYDYASKRFESGKMNAYEFNEVKLRLSKTAIELSQAKYEFIFRSKIIDFYLGLPIRL